MKTIGVVCALYNGEKYIISQLQSILEQSIQPSIVLMADDGSTDQTYDIVENWIEEHHLCETWKITRNPSNYGHAKNFIELLRKMDTEYVFFCDQDDIWAPNKIEIMQRCLDDNPCIDVLCSRFSNFADENHMMDEVGGSGKIVQSSFSARHFWPHGVIGAAMVVRRSAYKKYLKYWNENIEHDCFVWACANLANSSFFLDYITTYRRIHGGNASMQSNFSMEKRKRQVVSRITECDNLTRYVSSLQCCNTKRQQKWLRHYRNSLVLREKYLKRFSLIKFIVLCTWYGNCYLHYPQGIGLDTCLVLKEWKRSIRN